MPKCMLQKLKLRKLNKKKQTLMLGKLVVKIINSDTKELVRQIPTEEALALSKRMQDVLKVMYG